MNETKFDTLLNELRDIYVSQHEVKQLKEQIKDILATVERQQQQLNFLSQSKADITLSNGDEYD